MKMKIPFKLVFEFNKKSWRYKTYFLSSEVFKYSLITYLILLLAETLQEGFVSFFFNLNILLAFVLISGILMVLTHDEKLDPPAAPSKITRKDILFITLLAIGGGLLVYVKTYDLGIIAILISFLAAVIIILLSVLLFKDPK